jgi:hypothetical protein
MTISFEEWSQGMDFGRGEAADDARAGAQVVYDRMVQSGDYGTEIAGIMPGDSSIVEVDGKKWHRLGVDPSKITESRISLAGYDPNQHYMYSPEYGHLIADGYAQGLNKQAERVAMEDKADNPFYQKFLDSGGGVALVAAGGFAAAAAASAGAAAGAGASAAGGGASSVGGATGLDLGIQGLGQSWGTLPQGISGAATGLGLEGAGGLATGATAGLSGAGSVAGEVATGVTDLSSIAEIPEVYEVAPGSSPPPGSSPGSPPPPGDFAPPTPSDGGYPMPPPSTTQPIEPWVQGAAVADDSLINRVLGMFKGDMAKYALIQQGGGLIAGAFKPSAGDQAREVADERLRLEESQRAAIQPNFQVGNVRLPTPNAQPLRRPDGSLVYGPQGLINRNMRRV